MKIILLEDVPKVGKRHDIKNLKDGFAQNVLISKGLAVLATPKALADLDKKKEQIDTDIKRRIDDFKTIVDKLNNQKIIIKAKANDKGHLFKSVNSKDIVEEIKNSSGLILDENLVVMDHIKEVGVSKIILRKGNIEGEFDVEIISE